MIPALPSADCRFTAPAEVTSPKTIEPRARASTLAATTFAVTVDRGTSDAVAPTDAATADTGAAARTAAARTPPSLELNATEPALASTEPASTPPRPSSRTLPAAASTLPTLAVKLAGFVAVESVPVWMQIAAPMHGLEALVLVPVVVCAVRAERLPVCNAPARACISRNVPAVTLPVSTAPLALTLTELCSEVIASVTRTASLVDASCTLPVAATPLADTASRADIEVLPVVVTCPRLTPPPAALTFALRTVKSPVVTPVAPSTSSVVSRVSVEPVHRPSTTVPTHTLPALDVRRTDSGVPAILSLPMAKPPTLCTVRLRRAARVPVAIVPVAEVAARSISPLAVTFCSARLAPSTVRP